jgi:hypothetical protein
MNVLCVLIEKPLQPKDAGRPNHSMSVGNKKRYVPPAAGEEKSNLAKYEQIIWHAPHTQSTRSEAVTKSNELAHRRKFQPSFNEKIIEHSKYMTQKLKHERMVQLLAEAKMQFEKDLKEHKSSANDELGVAGLTDVVVEVAKRRSSIQEKLDLDDMDLADFEDEAFQM